MTLGTIGTGQRAPVLASLPERFSQGERPGASIVRFARQLAPAGAHQIAAGAAAGARCTRPVGTRSQAAATATTLTNATQQASVTCLQMLLMRQAVSSTVVDSVLCFEQRLAFTFHSVRWWGAQIGSATESSLSSASRWAASSSRNCGGSGGAPGGPCPLIASKLSSSCSTPRAAAAGGCTSTAARQLAGPQRTAKTSTVHCVHKANKEQ